MVYVARESSITVRVTESGIQAIDSLRGSWSRSEYVRQALTRAIKQGLRGPQGADL